MYRNVQFVYLSEIAKVTAVDSNTEEEREEEKEEDLDEENEPLQCISDEDFEEVFDKDDDHIECERELVRQYVYRLYDKVSLRKRVIQKLLC